MDEATEVASLDPDSSIVSMGSGVGSAQAQALERHVADLETLLGEYKNTVSALEGEVERLNRASASASNKSMAEWEALVQRASELETGKYTFLVYLTRAKLLYFQALQEAQAAITSRETQVDTLEQRLFELGGEIGCGRHIPPNTRVLSMAQNPAQEWADTRTEILERLKKENEILLGRVSELEERLSSHSSEPSSPKEPKETEHLVPRASYDVLREELASLQSQLTQKEKRLLRLTQVFTAKSSEFRDAIAAILGLKLAFYPNGQVRVTSVYDLSASFVFQPDSKPKSIRRSIEEGEGGEGGEEGMKMQLVAKGEGGPVELEGLMNTWVRDEMCIPCFMASVTLECFDKWKMEQRGM